MSQENLKTLLIENDGNGIATLIINRPDKLNALNTEVLNELESAIEFLEGDSNVSVIIVTGSGEKAFVAGADIKELNSLNKTEGEKLALRGQSIFSKIENCSKPVIAIVNGYALGGGAELAMACHIRIATENAVFGLPEVSLGLIPGYGGTQRLSQLIGKSKAMELILTGGQLKAEDAKSFRLVNDVCSSEEATNYAKKIASKMMKNGPVALTKAIKAVNAAFISEGFKKEAALFGDLCGTDDFKEGTSAFLEKRVADFKGK